MKKTYIQVKKLNDLFGNMAHGKVDVRIYKKLSYNTDECICMTVMREKELPIVFGDYWVYDIMPIIVNECGVIKLLICIDKPNDDWEEII